MAKFRSKLKRHTKGKMWSRGHSSTSNPENMKHRSKAKSRFFQPNLSLVPQENEAGKSSLTLESVLKHEARQSYVSNRHEPIVNDIAGSLKSLNIDGDELMSESQATFKTFASNYSACTNMSFKKLLNGFRQDSELHKEMLAILTALTEIIKERGGTESSTEYFLLLMETIDAGKMDSETIACISLLSMGIKTVPVAVLRKKFSDTAEKLMELLERYVETENSIVIRYIIGCLSVLLRAQDFSSWSYSSTLKYIDALLTFTIHSKPKLRKAAQHAIVSIIHGSCFMIDKTNDEETNVKLSKPPTYHPATERIVKFSLKQFKTETIANSQTIVLHILKLLHDTITCFKGDNIKIICEHLLSIMTATNVLIRTNCFHTFHALFLSRTINLNSEICAKLISAIYEYRPDRSDVRQTLAWLTVLKEGHIHLAKLDLSLSINSLPKLIEICSSDLWISERSEVVCGVSNVIKDILYECIKPGCATKDLAEQHYVSINKIITSITKSLSSPFGDVAKYVILTFSIVFEVCGEYFVDQLRTPLSILGGRYDTESSLRVHIEHAIIAAIKVMGPETVLKVIPLTDIHMEIIVEKSWLLPLLREGIYAAKFEFFANFVLNVASKCYQKWHDYRENGSVALSHTYELLCCQLWGLFPGFCRQPKDPENFRLIAKTIGLALVDNPEFRAPIFDGLIELITNSDETCKKEISKFSKNFLPRLFNIYSTKPNGSYEADLRVQVLQTIQAFLSIASDETLMELFETAKTQLKTLPPGSFTCDAVYDIVNLILIYQNEKNLKDFFETYLVPILKNEKSKIVAKDEQKLKKQQRKAYELLQQILSSDREGCIKFCTKNANSIQKVLLDALRTSCSFCQVARLKCLKFLIEKKKNITSKDKLITKSIPEVIITFKEYSTTKESVAQDLLTLIGGIYQNSDQLNDFIDIIITGFGGDEILITNTILALRSIVQSFTGNLTIKTLEFILEQVVVYLVQKNRAQVTASIAFLITFTKVLPSPFIANHLELIMKSLSAMMPDTKRYCRIQIGYLLKKLCKRFTADELIKLVPGNDEITHRRLKKIRKQLGREARQKLDEKNKENEDDDSEDEFVSGLEKRTTTIDEILADSDSDLSNLDGNDNEIGKNNKAGGKKKVKETFIQESPEDIVDLADIKSIGKIMSNKPSLQLKMDSTKKSKSNRGFKTAEDGRLIISDKFIGSDSDDDDDDSDASNKHLQLAGSKRMLQQEDDSSADEEMPPSRKRKAITSGTSIISGKSGQSKYTAGGKGIHRPVAASVKSNYTAGTSRTAGTKSAGNEYSSKKAKGDMKKKGKLDPYAYIPLSRNNLNRRKRAKNAGQFKSILTGAKKGAAKGVKNRIHKTYKK